MLLLDARLLLLIWRYGLLPLILLFSLMLMFRLRDTPKMLIRIRYMVTLMMPFSLLTTFSSADLRHITPPLFRAAIHTPLRRHYYFSLTL